MEANEILTKIDKLKMNITMEQEGNYMSLFDFLGKPAGMELGREVCNEAIRRKVWTLVNVRLVIKLTREMFICILRSFLKNILIN